MNQSLFLFGILVSAPAIVVSLRERLCKADSPALEEADLQDLCKFILEWTATTTIVFLGLVGYLANTKALSLESSFAFAGLICLSHVYPRLVASRAQGRDTQLAPQKTLEPSSR